MKFAAMPTIEPLESRIAPARVILVGAPDSQGAIDVNYTEPADAAQDALFLDTETDGDFRIAGKLGDGTPGIKDTFYLRLSAGDEVRLFNQGNSFEPYLTVNSGNIVAIFVDANRNNEVDANELTGIAMGKGASFILRDDVQGDVVANLNEFGTASLADDELVMDGLISSKQFIAGVEVTDGRIGGSIIAGGNINSVNVEGTVGSILSGDAAQGKMIDFFPKVVYGNGPNEFLDPDGGTGIISFSQEPGKVGGSIKNVFIDGLGTDGSLDPFNGLLKAGGGGTGAAGGSVNLVAISADADGFTIQGGAGGMGTTGKAGAGGSVSRVYVSGAIDATVDTVSILGGLGGSSVFAAGGAGGSVKQAYVGYRLFGSSAFPTDDLLIDKVVIESGAGGSGKTGGAGGSINGVDIRVKTQDTGVDDEIRILGGNGGGSSVGGGKAGAGGSLLNLKVRNQDLAPLNAYSDILAQGGDGGFGVLGSVGGKGGSVTNATFLGWEVQVKGGNGGEGKNGGAAGSLNNLLVEEGEEILTIGASFAAGFGGLGTAGSGGAGGNINGLHLVNSDLANFAINAGNAGDGGRGNGGKGGAGGFVQGVTIVDGDFSNGAVQSLQPLTIRTGSGGDGSKGGGAGGAMKLVSVEAKNVNADLFTGSGGDVLVGGTGKGGNAGSFDNVSLLLEQDVLGVPVFANATGGIGGDGGGANGAGGAGGSVRSMKLTAAGNGSIVAGDGGGGQNAGAVVGGASGKGGSVILSQVKAFEGTGTMIAGDAGVSGAKPGAGGSIMGLNAESRGGVFAKYGILIQAGDGSHGGAGGNIRYIGYGSSVIEFSPAPYGDINILAGDGSADGKKAGVGGSIIDVSGSLASEDPAQPGVIFSTTFLAGVGGGAEKGAAGGSIQDLAILNGGYAGAILTVQAGDAGNATNSPTGAKGGNVKNVIISAVGDGTVFRSVAAGNGGNALNKGGAGGNIDSVYADGIDIGNRNDVPFGFTQMGGVFVGTGGTALKDGTSGNVSNVVAKGIGAIVAGRDLVPKAANNVSNVILSGSDTLLRENNVFVQPGPFKLAFTATGVATESVVGSNEVQTIILRELRTANVPVQYTFGADTTPIIAGNATAATIQNALNALPSVQAVGGVTVTVNGTDVEITFVTPGDKTGLFSVSGRAETGLFPDSATATDVETTLNSLPTIQYLGANFASPTTGAVDVTGKNGSFKVSFEQFGDVQLLEGIEVFSSTLTELTKGFADETLSTETTPGAQNLAVAEVRTGQFEVLVTEDQPGAGGNIEFQSFNLLEDRTILAQMETPTMQFSFKSTGTFDEATAGTPTVAELQTLPLASIRTDANATFTLSFNGQTTIPLAKNASAGQIQAAVNALSTIGATGLNSVTVTITGAGATELLNIKFNNVGARTDFSATVSSSTSVLSVGADANAMQTALNALAPVKFIKPDRITGALTVVVVPPGLDPNAYQVEFNEPGDQELLVLNTFRREIQDIDHQELDDNPGSVYKLSFSRDYLAVENPKGSSVTPIQREVQDINLGSVLGDVNTDIVFTFGNKTTPAIKGNATDTEIRTLLNQTFNNSVLSVTRTGGTLKITLTATADNPNLFTVTANSTMAGTLPAAATASDVQTALNGLSTIKGPSGTESVTVAKLADPDTDFEVKFSANGERNPIVVAISSFEIQQVDVSSLQAEATGAFRLAFTGQYTPELLPNALPADVQLALNNLPAIAAAGGVTVTAGSAAGLYDVQFNLKGNQLPITVRTEIDEVQNVDFTAAKDLTLGVNLGFTADETIQGDAAAGLEEIQTLNMGSLILGTSGVQYTISYFNETLGVVETTKALPNNATDAEIQQALEDLDVFAPGDLSVTHDSTSITISFTNIGDQPELFSAVATQSAVLPANSTEGQIETALNNLATVKAAGFGGAGGTVDVTMGAGSSFMVRFSSGIDMPMISATQEENLQVVTTQPGLNNQVEIQAFSPIAKGQPIDAIYAMANLIGFYSDHTEIDANVFHFLHEGVLTSAGPNVKFVPGDQPIDGLLFANKVTGISVTPEAYLIGGVFYDWNNII